MTRWALGVGLLSASILLVFSGRGYASHEPFDVYEDWSNPTIRSDRWRGGDFGGTPLNAAGEPTMGAAAEVTREIAHGHTGFLHLRYRRNGGTASSVGGAGNSNFPHLPRPFGVGHTGAPVCACDP